MAIQRQEGLGLPTPTAARCTADADGWRIPLTASLSKKTVSVSLFFALPFQVAFHFSLSFTLAVSVNAPLAEMIPLSLTFSVAFSVALVSVGDAWYHRADTVGCGRWKACGRPHWIAVSWVTGVAYIPRVTRIPMVTGVTYVAGITNIARVTNITRVARVTRVTRVAVPERGRHRWYPC